MNQLFNMLGNSSNPLKPNLGSTQQQSPLSQMSHLMEFIKTTSPEQAKAQVEQLIKERGITQQLATCCCDTQRAIDGVNYNAAQNTASINANTTAAVQKVLDAIQKDKIEALQGQVNQLQLQSALCGVVRYPNSTTFTAGYNPYFNANTCGCGTTF